MNLIQNKYFQLGLAALLGALIAFNLIPEKVKVETKIVEKIVYKESKVKKSNKETRKTTTTKADGSKVEEVIIVDKGIEQTDIDLNKDKTSHTITNQTNWHVGIIWQPYVLDYTKFSFNPNYTNFGLSVQRRVIGDLYLGGFISTTGGIGISTSVSF